MPLSMNEISTQCNLKSQLNGLVQTISRIQENAALRLVAGGTL